MRASRSIVSRQSYGLDRRSWSHSVIYRAAIDVPRAEYAGIDHDGAPDHGELIQSNDSIVKARDEHGLRRPHLGRQLPSVSHCAKTRTSDYRTPVRVLWREGRFCLGGAPAGRHRHPGTDRFPSGHPTNTTVREPVPVSTALY